MKKKALLCIVVEDEPLAQQLLENYIRRVKELQLVALCENFDDTFKILKSTHVDLIFLDWNLKTENGIDFIRKMKELYDSRYYIILTTAISRKNLNAAEIFDTHEVILVDHLTKPFSFDRFLEAINKIISPAVDPEK